MEVQEQSISFVQEVQKHVISFFEKHMPEKYVYHDLEHTRNVVNGVTEIGQGCGITEREIELLQIAAWFHDTGYVDGPKGHEERGCTYALEFIKEKDYSDAEKKIITDCIMATKLPANPQTLLEQIICDADLSHLGKKNYWDRCSRVRLEMNQIQEVVLSDLDWVDFELEFLEKHQYHTPYAQRIYNKRKKKNIRQLIKQKLRLSPESMVMAAYSSELEKKSSKKSKKKKEKNPAEFEIKDLRLGRGVETMYRVSYRTHVNLSSIADNKANIMLSINALIISIIISSLVPSLDENQRLIIPTIVLLLVCLVSVVYATLSTRPKVTEGKFTREDIEEKRSNLLFFGNYYNMEMDDFHWGMMEMIKDQDFLYSSMTRDLYWLGKVLAKKYKYLSICYKVFMYGLIISVILFAIAFSMGDKVMI